MMGIAFMVKEVITEKCDRLLGGGLNHKDWLKINHQCYGYPAEIFHDNLLAVNAMNLKSVREPLCNQTSC